jgi:hypothetical protein
MCWPIPEVKFLREIPLRVKRNPAISSGKSGGIDIPDTPEKNAGNPLDLF